MNDVNKEWSKIWSKLYESMFTSTEKKYRSYATQAQDDLETAWEILDSARRLISKIGDSKSYDEIEALQESVKKLRTKVILRNKGY